MFPSTAMPILATASAMGYRQSWKKEDVILKSHFRAKKAKKRQERGTGLLSSAEMHCSKGQGSSSSSDVKSNRRSDTTGRSLKEKETDSLLFPLQDEKTYLLNIHPYRNLSFMSLRQLKCTLAL